mgnify:CR=1 FL=1|tara:strand:- start:2672 stop:2878 length:207 start_codon:yes stop_codon:yes gene_type:complete
MAKSYRVSGRGSRKVSARRSLIKRGGGGTRKVSARRSSRKVSATRSLIKRGGGKGTKGKTKSPAAITP